MRAVRRDTLSAAVRRDTCQTAAGGTRGFGCVLRQQRSPNASSRARPYQRSTLDASFMSVMAPRARLGTTPIRVSWTGKCRVSSPTRAVSQRLPRARYRSSNVPQRAPGLSAGSEPQERLEPRCALIEAPSHRRAARNPLPETLSRRVSKRSHGCAQKTIAVPMVG